VPLPERIAEWKQYPNALGSEAAAAVIVAEVARALGEDVPEYVDTALKKLALRGTMRDIASAIQRGEAPNPGIPGFHDVVDIGAASAGLSWTEATRALTDYFDASLLRLG
jgi:hypothetical protein